MAAALVEKATNLQSQVDESLPDPSPQAPGRTAARRTVGCDAHGANGIKSHFVALPIVIGVTAIAEPISERGHAEPPSG
jgi:hypothetical protein